MSLNEKIIALAEEVNYLLSKERPIVSHDFINLATRMMNFSDLASNLERLDQEERKDVEYEWIWKENII
jgi:hypothetical protein